MGLISFYICKASYIKCNYIERVHYENTLKNIIYNCWNYIIRIIFSNLVWWWRYDCFKRRRFWCIYGLAYFLLYWDMVFAIFYIKKDSCYISNSVYLCFLIRNISILNLALFNYNRIYKPRIFFWYDISWILFIFIHLLYQYCL